MKLKLPLPSFNRYPNQHSGILRNRYSIVVDTGDYAFFNVIHEALNPDKQWNDCYSWWTLGVNTAERLSVWKEEIPDKTFLFGLLKCYKDYYDGPIVTWEFGPLFVNYRW